MNLFEAVKDSVTTRQAAESYGLQVKHGGMCAGAPSTTIKRPA